MNENQVIALIEQYMAENGSDSQYSVATVPYHTHNRVDSPAISAQYLLFGSFCVWGTVGTSSGQAVIKNPNINKLSVVLVTSQDSSDPPWGVANKGFATIGSTTNSTTLNYLIIFYPTPQ